MDYYTDTLLVVNPIFFAALSLLVGLLFIISLAKLNDKNTSSSLRYGLSGFLIALLLTLPSSLNYSYILIAIGISLVGIIAGLLVGIHTKITSLPELISTLQLLIGFVIVGFCLIDIYSSANEISILHILTAVFGIYIFSTGFISALKIQGLISAKDRTNHLPSTLGSLSLILLLIFFYFQTPENQIAISLPILSLSLILFIYFANCVAGPNVPVLICHNNSVIGLAFLFLGMTHEMLLLSCVGGIIFGCSVYLTLSLTRAMNASLKSILFP
jgi:H+-translocating NAD(P) transhydrogenase